jgi:hypothetical protein
MCVVNEPQGGNSGGKLLDGAEAPWRGEAPNSGGEVL